MKKVLELLLDVKNSPVTLYYSGSDFTGIIEDIMNEEVIILMCDGRTVFLDGDCLIGFSYLSPEYSQSDHNSKTNIIQSATDDKKTKDFGSKVQSFENKLHTIDDTMSVRERIIENVKNRAQKYPNIKMDIEKVIQQIDNSDSNGADRDLLLTLEQLKEQNPGCHSALDTLIAWCHYVGGNKEEAIRILWSVQCYHIALMIIREIWNEAIYLDCLGYVISDLDVIKEEFSKNLFCSYVLKCAEKGDVSLLTDIMEDAFGEGQIADELIYEVLYYLILKKDKDAGDELDADIPILPLIRKVKQLYPGNGMLLERQDSLQERLDKLFVNAPVRLKEKEVISTDRYADKVHTMIRPRYYIGVVHERFKNDGYFQFRVKLNADHTERFYMHPYQIADPLLLHKLMTYKNVKGTKILFRFGYNGYYNCIADAVMPYQDRAAYHQSLFEKTKSTYEETYSFRYLSDRIDEAKFMNYGKEELERSSKEAQKENIDQAELIIFFYNCMMNRSSWSVMGYPQILQDFSELIEYLENYEKDDPVKWADGIVRILRRTEHNDWANIFQSIREGLSKSHPLYVKSKVDLAEVSSEELQNAYIFPEAENENYEMVLYYIEHWKKKMVQKRKNSGSPWLRMCKLEEVCQAKMDMNDEAFVKSASELFNLVTETQKKKLALLFVQAGIEGDKK